MSDSIAVEVVSASVGGAFSAAALYPLEVLKTKMQAESKASNSTTSSTEPGSERESSSTSQDASNDSDIEVIDVDISSPTGSDGSRPKSTSSTSGKSKSEMTMIEYAKDMYAKDGITPFYAGIETSSFQSAAEKALYFFAYTGLKNVYSLFSGNHEMGTAINLLLGCMAEWGHLPITLPIDCWTTQIQTGKNGNKAPLAILMTMLREGDGLAGMYTGIQAYTVLCFKPAIQYTVFEQVKKIMIARKKSQIGRNRKSAETLTTMEAFLLGMVARTVATVAVFPYLRAKVMLQSQKSSESGAKGTDKPNIPAMIVKMYSNGGLGECFQGIGPELTRGVFSAALMMACKEKISVVVKEALK